MAENQPKEYDAVLGGHTDGVDFVTISADRQTLISGSLDGTIKIWRMP